MNFAQRHLCLSLLRSRPLRAMFHYYIQEHTSSDIEEWISIIEHL